MSYPQYDASDTPRTAYDYAVSGQLDAMSRPYPAEPAPEADLGVYPIASAEDLLQPVQVSTYTVQIPALKRAVRVRALTRAEALKLRQAGEMDLAELERRMLVDAMVEPKLTYAQAKTWYDQHGTTTLTPVLDKILSISGLVKGGKEALKEGMNSFRDEPGAGD